MSRSQAGPQNTELHILLADWGEGTSHAAANEGGGAEAASGDATWVHTFSDTSTWATPGGDFSATTRATASVDAIGDYTWGSTPEMVADVQGWLVNPSTNSGGLLLGNEATNQTTKRFDSRQNPLEEDRLVLIVEFTPPG